MRNVRAAEKGKLFRKTVEFCAKSDEIIDDELKPSYKESPAVSQNTAHLSLVKAMVNGLFVDSERIRKLLKTIRLLIFQNQTVNYQIFC